MDKSRMYQLYELRDEIKKALSNSESVEESERTLSAIIIASDKAEMFKDFTKSLSENWKRYASDRMALSYRLKRLDKIIARYEAKTEESKLVAEIVSLVLEAIGATKSEGSSNEA